MIVIYYSGVQHVFMETDMVLSDGLGVHAFQEGSIESVPENIRDSAPTRVHILDSATFYGPLSSFMRRLQREFGIESDVSLEFNTIALSVPINMSFAESDLSLAHIYAIAATLNEEGAENAAPILTASLVVAPTNFVRKYNELVQTFKSKRSLKISSGKAVRPALKRTQSKSPDATQMVTDETTGTTGTRSRSDSSSSASSTWSQMAACDSASLAVLSDSEANSEMSGSRRSSFVGSPFSSSRSRKGLTTSTGILFGSPLTSPPLSRHHSNTSPYATPGHGLQFNQLQHIGTLPRINEPNLPSLSAPNTARGPSSLGASSASSSPNRSHMPQPRTSFPPFIDPMFRMLDDTESLSVSGLNPAQSVLNRSLSPSRRPAPLRHFSSTGGLNNLPILPAVPPFSDHAAATQALSPAPTHPSNRKRPRASLGEADYSIDSASEEGVDYPPKRKVDSLTPHDKHAS